MVAIAWGRRAVSTLLAAALLLSLAHCGTVVPYDPGCVAIDRIEWPSDAFERVQDVVEREYPEVALADRERFAWQTAWCARNYVDTAAKRRLTLWREGNGMCAVVEVRYLQGAIGTPVWSSIRSNKFWERELLVAVAQALEGS